METESKLLFDIGFVENKESFIDELKVLTKVQIDSNVFGKKRFNDIRYYTYVDGNPIEVDEENERVYVKAVNTGYKNLYNEEIFAVFTRRRDKNNFTGVKYETKYQLENRLNAYKIGPISFKNYGEANKFISELVKQILPGEVWEFKDCNTYRKKTDYPILESYYAIA